MRLLDAGARVVQRARQQPHHGVDDYERRIDSLLPALDAARLSLAVRIAEVADTVRGFGPVKEKNMKQAAATWQALEREWASTPAAPAAKAA